MAAQTSSIKAVRGLSSRFIVDGFNFVEAECKSYFLTHYHGDHTTGLHAGFDLGTIYCSEVTARLVVHDLGVASKLVCVLPLHEWTTVEGVHVMPVDACHCPGAVMFFFDDPTAGRRVLHCGDFRAEECVVESPHLAAALARGPLDELYLDTTYCRPTHTFPDQPAVLRDVEAIVRHELGQERRTLFVVGTYQIGKEKVAEAAARAAQCRILVSGRRCKVLQWCDRWDKGLYSTVDPSAGPKKAASEEPGTDSCCDGGPAVLIVPFGGSSHEELAHRLEEWRPRFRAVVGFRASGWTYSRASDANVQDKSSSRRKRARPSGTKSFPVKRGPLEAAAPRWEDGDREEEAAVDTGGVGLQEATGQGYAGSLEERGTTGGSPSPPPRGPEGPLLDGPSGYRYRVWAEAGPQPGEATRLYMVPYSEHSSFPQLLQFVGRVRPLRITPTVNATDAAERDRLVRHFLHLLDLRADPRRMEYYLGGGKAARSSAAGGGAALTHGSGDTSVELIQTGVRALREIIGAAAPREYLQALLLESRCSVEAACDLHFSANQGKVPKAAAATLAVATASGTTDKASPPEPFPRGIVCVVHGDDKTFSIFGSKSKAEQRLRELGAQVLSRKSPRVTHVIHGSRTKPDTIPKVDQATMQVKGEDWLFRFVRSKQAGTLRTTVYKRPVPPPVPGGTASCNGVKKGSAAPAAPGEVRSSRLRKPTPDKLQRAARALNDQLFLIQWTTLAPGVGQEASGPPQHRFLVLGTTGNVYRVEIHRFPSCSCPDARDRGVTCKHLYFVFLKVLGVDHRESHIPYQRELLPSELRQLFQNPPLVRHQVLAVDALRREVPVEGGMGSHCRTAEQHLPARPAADVPQRPVSKDDPCAICFDRMDESPAGLLDFCARGCGQSFHRDCLERWFACRTATSQGEDPRQCPRCRTGWSRHVGASEGEGNAGGAQPLVLTEEGYLNLRAFQPGTRRQRDESGYSEWLDWHRRRKRVGGAAGSAVAVGGHDDATPGW